MKNHKISAIEQILSHLENQTDFHNILWSDLEEAQKELTVIKHTEKEVEKVSAPTLREELTKLAPEILGYPAMLDDHELLALSIYSTCGSDMLIHAVQVNALLKTFDTHSHIQYHLIAALKMQWEIIYYG